MCVCVWGRDEGSRISYLGLEAPFSLAFHGRAAPLAAAALSRSPITLVSTLSWEQSGRFEIDSLPPSLSSRFSRSVDRDFREEIELSRMIRFSSFSIDRKHFWDAKSVSSVNFRYKIHRGRIILCHREDFLRSFREFSRSFNVIIFTLNTRRFILHEEKDDFLEWISNNFFFFFRKNIAFGLLTIFFYANFQ